MKRFTSFVAALAVSFSLPANAQQSPGVDPARTDSVVQQAMRTYQQGLDSLKEASSTEPTAQPGTSSGTQRELRLEEAVALALEKNLDIQVAKLEPQSVDFQVAGFRNTFQPVLASTVGQRDLFQLPTRTINGGTRVSQATTTYNASITQEVPLFGGNYSIAWTNQRVASSDALATRNPLFTTGLVATYAQPLLRGFKTDNLRQQLAISLINRDISEESARATVAQTLANVRNAYWDLVFAQSAVEVALRATELADKLVEDNQARVEVGTLAPLDILAFAVANTYDLFLGERRAPVRRTQRAFAHWAPGMPGYHAILSMRAFALEESGEYGRAEEAAHWALEDEPADLRAVHTVAHVHEMLGRPEAGMRWMGERSAAWSGLGDASTHHWWHVARIPIPGG